LFDTSFQRRIQLVEPVAGDLVGLEELIDLLHLLFGLVPLLLQGVKERLFLPYCVVGLVEMRGHIVGQEEELFQLLVKNAVEVINRNLTSGGSSSLAGEVGRQTVKAVSATPSGSLLKHLEASGGD